MKSLFLFFIVGIFSWLSASVVGVIQKADGDVKIKNDKSIKKSSAKSGMEINLGDLLSTSKKSTAILKLKDNSILVLDADSMLHFVNSSSVEQQKGKIYYKITKRDAKNSIEVKTSFAIIGIKGTTFVVNATKDSSVKLQEGLIGIKSIKEEFELYVKEINREFDNFVSENEAEFNNFVENDLGVPRITKEFDLKDKRSVSFNKNIAIEEGFDEDDNKEFLYFEKLLNSKK